jgi:sugar/nucleoside kinase (ribokinase family)/ubiquinone/menaquinone biosynthesis C-methylase UbiE
MEILGGGSTHAAMGMRVWSDHIGIVAAVGKNLPANSLKELGQFFDLQGLQWRETVTPRAWQVYETDGRRTEVFRTSLEEFHQITPQPAELPAAYQPALGVHLQCAAPEPLLSWVRHLRNSGCKRTFWEPWDIFCIPENRDEFRRLLPLVDIFSPNLLEAQRLTNIGRDDPASIAADLLADGVGCVALRMGARGSLVALQGGVYHWIPAFPVNKIVDVTGAGNAYCGGFLVGLEECGDYLQAGLYGTVSASLALGQFGALYPLEAAQQQATDRLEQMRQYASGHGHSNPRRSVFDRLAPDWDSRPAPPGLEEKLERILSASGISPGMTILDMGSGTGLLIPGLLRRQPGQILAVDLSPAMLAILANKHRQAEIVLPLAADGSQLPLTEKSVDIIFCHAVFPHFPDSHFALREFKRVLRPGGQLVISHIASREQVNAVHLQAADEILHHDLLPPASQLTSTLNEEGYTVAEAIENSEIYLVKATTDVGLST